MGRLCFSLLLLSLACPTAFATTSQDLRSRIKIDGDVSDFEDDEWILDAFTVFPEAGDDSRWGADNDVQRIGLTWDFFNLYIAVPAVTVSSTLMLFLDVGCGGVNDLRNAGDFRRNIEFSANSPNVLIKVTHLFEPPQLAILDCDNPINVIDPGLYQGTYDQEGTTGGALEVAIPWELLPGFERGASGVTVSEESHSLRVLAVVTGGLGMGAADAAPNPSVVLENDSTRLAILNNFVQLPLDSAGNGSLAIGVSPRAVASYAVARLEDTREILPLQVHLQRKLIAPGEGTSLDFLISLNPPQYTQSVYVSGRIYSASGRLLRNLFNDEPLILSGGGVTKSWDGRDGHGNIVPGGIYVLAVSGGVGKNSSKKTVKASFAVIR
ncbi:MAG: hypothetical protein OEN01_05320 [Candidatus Krumholzibacteria bacterium]|nr:hypothetical protein [Candidatus Krumholzibacteria bacterium]